MIREMGMAVYGCNPALGGRDGQIPRAYYPASSNLANSRFRERLSQEIRWRQQASTCGNKNINIHTAHIYKHTSLPIEVII